MVFPNSINILEGPAGKVNSKEIRKGLTILINECLYTFHVQPAEVK